jgi:hypothetical protein
VLEDLLNHAGLNDESDDPHRGPAPWAHEGICLVDAAVPTSSTSYT